MDHGEKIIIGTIKAKARGVDLGTHGRVLTKQKALAAAKARGVELGKNGKVLARQNQEKAATFANGMAKTVQQLHNDGFTTIRQLVEELNRREIPSASGARWHIPTVHRLLRRLNQLTA